MAKKLYRSSAYNENEDEWTTTHYQYPRHRDFLIFFLGWLSKILAIFVGPYGARMFKSIFKRKSILPLLLIPVLFLGACSAFPKEEDPEYSIVGTWGMVSGLYKNANGTSVLYDRLHEGMYYSRYEFRENGTLIQTQYLDIELYGTYEYDEPNSKLIFGWEPFDLMYDASVFFASANEMTITIESPLGSLTQDFIRIEDQ